MEQQTNHKNPIVRFFGEPYRYAALFALLLTAAFAFTLLDAFVIPKALRSAPENDVLRLPSVSEQSPPSDSNDSDQSRLDDPEDEIVPVITANSYKDNNIEITIETVRVYETEVYIADVKVNSAAYLKTAFANNVYGRNINEKTSAIAGKQNAIFAVNGDYYGFRDGGWVLRNGVLYRSGGSDAALLMDMAGNLSCSGNNGDIEKQASNLWQIWSFGPQLVADGEVAVTKNQEISGRSSNSNPRTAIGQIDSLHYLFIVSDGRTRESAGLSLYQLASLFAGRGCSIAYNLDGGGSTTMVFNGQIINKPTTGGNRISEREVSDIVYIGY